METHDSIACIYEENKDYNVISMTILQSMCARRLNALEIFVEKYLIVNCNGLNRNMNFDHSN